MILALSCSINSNRRNNNSKESIDGSPSTNGLHMNGQDSLVQPLMTDFYQITMCYANLKTGTHKEPAVFDGL
ncbi:hypothetical protein CAEBREN_16328 [Caenorhabditis brenneri]|uniref:Uncharacterized protein n=1 Tax=Caenorhabditis brenneri TaxID=135651 RepID=G0NJW6_CAEBE|nr:hypothetical protein CAEBREN_16328 [Caenorhabditis brenneri]